MTHKSFSCKNYLSPNYGAILNHSNSLVREFQELNQVKCIALIGPTLHGYFEQSTLSMHIMQVPAGIFVVTAFCLVPYSYQSTLLAGI